MEKKKNKTIWILTTLCIAIIVIAAVLIYHYQTTNHTNDNTSVSTTMTPTNVPDDNGITVSFENYSPLMSSVPQMPFQFDYKDDNDVEISLSADKNGMLSIWNVDNLGSWSCTKSAKELSCKSGDTIYWQQTDSAQKDSTYEITATAIKNGKSLDKKIIHIFLDDNDYFTATVE